MENENEKLILIRKHLGLSQAVFAHKLGLARSSLCDIEHQKTGVSPRIKLLLYSIFNVNPDWFEYGVGDMFTYHNPTYDEFFEIFEQLSKPLQQFLLDTARHLLDIQDDL